MSQGVLAAARNKICGANRNQEVAEEQAEATRRQQRNASKGILATSDDIRGAFDDEENTCFYVDVTPEQLDELSELSCYDDCGVEGRDARRISHRHTATEQFVRVTDAPDKFAVSIEYVGVKGDALTNDIIEDFANTFHMGFIGTFDPLAEDHEEPVVCVRPW